MSDETSGLPNPSHLLEEAEQEKPRRVHDDYAPVIQRLREKKFTFREIAAWLQHRGVDIDHNTAWRIYTKGMRPEDANGEAFADMEAEEMEAGGGDLTPARTLIGDREFYSTPAKPETQSSSASAPKATANKTRASRRSRKP